MDFNFTTRQKLIQSSIREFLKKECPSDKVRELEEDARGYDPQLWKKMAELGWIGIVFPKEYGGSASSFIDLIVLSEEIGKAAFPSPFFSTVIECGMLISEDGSEDQKKDLLLNIAQGNLIMALAQYEANGSYHFAGIDMAAKEEAGRYTLNGTKMFVKDANIADKFIVVARTGNSGVSLFIVDARAPGITWAKIPTIGMDNTCEVIFRNVQVNKADMIGPVSKGQELLEKMNTKATVVKCAEMVGGCKTCIDLAVSYSKKREQYGRQIGGFQIIQHYMANMLVAYDTSYNYLYKVAWMINNGFDVATEASVLKTCVNRNYKFISERAVQIHGCFGTSREGDVGLHYRRAKSFEYMMGDTNFHHEKISEVLLKGVPRI